MPARSATRSLLRQRQAAKVIAAPRSTWLSKSAAQTTADYGFEDIRSFQVSVIRAYAAMQQTQRCAKVLLSTRLFGEVGDLRHTVWCCRGADNTPPRITCEDRELTLRIVSPHCMGADASHGGLWLSRTLVCSLLVGDEGPQASDENFVCKCPLGLFCPGKKANEAHQLLRETEDKPKKVYVTYEPTDRDYAND